MSDVVIKVQDLGKEYRIGGQEATYQTLRDTLSYAVHTSIGRLVRRASTGANQFIWALRDVSFQIERGEVVGIIGNNGAGKSTLLKILSQITRPSKGCARIRGRVGSLLEVGTAFHRELNGRENIYLNGAVLGMKRAEIKSKFDEIVEFADVEKFIDTPVKHYSSGMYLRLAFAVAAHLDPEILLVDEVLAVGDQAFQKKCLGKMQDVSSQGRTVLFVSHNMPAIATLCPRSLLFQKGRLIMDGPSHDVVGYYLRGGRETTAEKVWDNLSDAPGSNIVRLRAARIRGEKGQVLETVDIRQPVTIEIEYEVLEQGHNLIPYCHFFTDAGILAFISGDINSEWRQKPRPRGRFTSTVQVPGNFLAEGEIVVGTAMLTVRPKHVHYFVENALAFQVLDRMDGETARGDMVGQIPGIVRPLLTWTTRFKSQ